MRLPKSKSLLYDIYGAYVRRAYGWIAVADLVTLLGQLGVDEQAVRSSVSRMSRNGMLLRRRRRGRIGYELSPEADRIFGEGDLAIFGSMEPALVSDGWVLVVFSVPEGERDRRHQLRSQLVWLGYGNLGSGVWIAPRRVLERTVETVRRLDLERYVDVFEAHHRAFGDPRSLARRCWDLDELAAMYEAFVRSVEVVLDRWNRSGAGLTDLDAFVDYTAVLHQWRKMPYLDPGLPLELVPDNWQGRTAARHFHMVVDRLEKRARRHVESVITA